MTEPGIVDAPEAVDELRRRARRDAGHHLGPAAASARTRSSTRCGARSRDPEYHYVVTCTTRARAAGRGRWDRLPLPRRARRSPPCAPRAACSRPTRSTATGTARRAARSARRSPTAATSSSRSTSRAPRWSRRRSRGALLIFLIPPSLEDLFQRLRSRATETADELELRQRNAADRARPAGGLRLRRDQRDRPGRADRRADRRDHRRRARSPAPGSTPGRRSTHGRPLDPPARPVEVAVDAAGRGGDRTYTYLVPDGPGRSRAGRGGPGRVRAAAGARDRRSARPTRLGGADGRRPAQADRGSGAGRRPAAAAADACARARDRRPLPGAAGARAPGDAAARPARAARAGGRARARAGQAAAALAPQAAPSTRSSPISSGSSSAGRGRSATWPDRMDGPACSAACGRSSRDGRVSLEWTLLGAGAGPRYERWIRLTEAGREAAATAAAARPGTSGGRWPVARSVRARRTRSRELAAGRPDGQPAADLSGRHGSAAVAGLVRRGLAEAEVRERPRRPLAARPAGRRGGRPRRERPAAGPGRGGRADPRGDRRRAIRGRCSSTA